ncbi:hypothetical protein Fmac_015763 [Flemingia macrophylla]|uniref:Uncharacterized protein n=1 Tax=Flemingia macrophylla TaxID=520843 RepID=A0ABD1MHL1_9FABA
MEKHRSNRDHGKTQKQQGPWKNTTKHSRVLQVNKFLKPIAEAHLQAHLLTFLSQETSIHVLRVASFLAETHAVALTTLVVLSDTFKEKRGVVKALHTSFLSSLASSNSDI